jgi:hypothetical protein
VAGGLLECRQKGGSMRLSCVTFSILGLLITMIPSCADPELFGFWLSSTPAPSQGFTENVLWEFFPEGDLDEHWQHTLPGQPIYMNCPQADVNTYPTLVEAANGRLTETEEDHSTRSGSYVVCPDKKKLIVKFDDVSFAFLFIKYGDIQNAKEWTGHSDANGLPFDDANGGAPGDGITSYLSPGGVAHWVDPGFIGVWISSMPAAANSPIRTSLWEVHPEGKSTLHVQNVSPLQPLDLASSDHDIQTMEETLDAFGGRFVMASQNGGAKDTGSYQFTKDGFLLVFDKGGPRLSFKRYGSFNPDGSIRKQSSPWL